MNFSIEKGLIGNNSNIVFDSNKILEQDNIDLDSFCLLQQENGKLDLLLKINGFSLPEFPTDEYKKMMSLTLKNEACNKIPWQKVMPKDKWNSLVKIYCLSVQEAFEKCDLSYLNIFNKSNKILNNLSNAKINLNSFMNSLSDDKAGILYSFYPDSDGFSQKIEYSRTEAKTGRLTVESGPRILNIKKEIRSKIIKSRFNDGRLISIDYISLEPRVALLLAGHDPPKDIYGHINDNVLKQNDITRNLIKKLVISAIYGASQITLSEEAKKENLDLNSIISLLEKIKEYFKIKEITNNLINEYRKNGFIRNYYGRIIQEETGKHNVLYNNYVQSTAVDVALLGFSSIEFNDKNLPMFVIHDDLIIDCEKSYQIEFPTDIIVEGFGSNRFYLNQKG